MGTRAGEACSTKVWAGKQGSKEDQQCVGLKHDRADVLNLKEQSQKEKLMLGAGLKCKS